MAFIETPDRYETREIGEEEEKSILRDMRGMSIASRHDTTQSIEHECPECKQPMDSTGLAYLCNSCGRTEEIVGYGTMEMGSEIGGSEAMENYSTSETSAAPLCVAGHGNHRYQHNLVSSTTNYKKVQHRHTMERMKKIMHEYNGPKPPPDVCSEAAELYYQVQQFSIIRADVLKGTMAACLYLKCKQHKMSRRPKEIADIFGIALEKLSEGRNILDDLRADGKIKDCSVKEVFDVGNEIESFLTRYFESLNIPETQGELKYKEFSLKLIHFCQKYRIGQNSVPSSQCAGVINILAQCCPSLSIDREAISAASEISKATFSRFSNEIFKYLKSDDELKERSRKRLYHLFEKYQIKLSFSLPSRSSGKSEKKN